MSRRGGLELCGGERAGGAELGPCSCCGRTRVACVASMPRNEPAERPLARGEWLGEVAGSSARWVPRRERCPAAAPTQSSSIFTSEIVGPSMVLSQTSEVASTTVTVTVSSPSKAKVVKSGTRRSSSSERQSGATLTGLQDMSSTKRWCFDLLHQRRPSASIPTMPTASRPADSEPELCPRRTRDRTGSRTSLSTGATLERVRQVVQWLVRRAPRPDLRAARG